jgi:hypothetical protein
VQCAIPRAQGRMVSSIFYVATEKHYLMAGVWYEVWSTLTVRGAHHFSAHAAR